MSAEKPKWKEFLSPAKIMPLLVAIGSFIGLEMQHLGVRDDADALFKSSQVEMAIMRAQMDVVLKNLGIELDLEGIRKTLIEKHSSTPGIGSAYAQELPKKPKEDYIEIEIDGCRCLCPIWVEEAPPQVQEKPKPKKKAKDAQKQFEQSIEQQWKSAPKDWDGLHKTMRKE